MAIQTYEPHEWITGELITADKMNNIEGFLTGIQDAFVSRNDNDVKTGSLTINDSYLGFLGTNQNITFNIDSYKELIRVKSLTSGSPMRGYIVFSNENRWGFHQRETGASVGITYYMPEEKIGSSPTEPATAEILATNNWTKYIHLDSIPSQNVLSTDFTIIQGSNTCGKLGTDTNGRVQFINYYNDSHYDIYTLPSATSTSSGTIYEILTTKNNILSPTTYFSRTGDPSSWWDGRDHAFIRQTSSNTNYFPMLSMKTPNGSWEIGTYGNSQDTPSNKLHFAYIPDSTHTAGRNDGGQKVYYLDTDGVFSGIANKANILANERTLTIGSTGKTFNGSANVTWSLSEIGAAAVSHNHSAGNITSGTLGVARGGTGATTFTSGAVLVGNGTGAIQTRSISDFAMANHTHSNYVEKDTTISITATPNQYGQITALSMYKNTLSNNKLWSVYTQDNCFAVREFTSTNNSYYENYLLPSPTTVSGTSPTYTILTTKQVQRGRSSVTIPAGSEEPVVITVGLSYVYPINKRPYAFASTETYGVHTRIVPSSSSQINFDQLYIEVWPEYTSSSSYTAYINWVIMP